MSNAKRDENSRATIICASKNDGKTIVVACAEANHSLCVEDNTTGTDNGNNLGNAMLDENSVSVWTALSSANDGSIVEIYADPITEDILIDSH